MSNQKDFFSGILFLVLGGGAVLISVLNYRLGTARAMGPGFFPVIVGSVVAVIGVVIALRALTAKSSEHKPEPFSLRGLLTVLLSVIAFALLLRPFGLVASVAVLVVLSRLAKPGHPLEIAALGVIMVGIAVGIFKFGLGMPLKIWPW